MRTELVLAALLALAPAASARAEGGARLSPAAAAQLDEGLHRLYSLDYPQSRAAFRKLIELEPDNPFGYLFEAGGIWWESSQEYGLFTSTPTLQGLFEQDVEAALRKSDAYMDSKDKRQRADGYFVSGMALGTLGQWRLMKHHYLDAFFAGKKAVKHLKKCLKLDSDYADARLGLGVFDYQSSHLSGVLKLGILLGMRGDEKRGLEGIVHAMEHARYATHQSAEILSQIYIADKKDWARALPVVQRLRAAFPESPYFTFLETTLHYRLGDWDASLAQARALYGQFELDPERFRPKWLTLVCGQAGPDCLSESEARAALAWFDKAEEATAREKPDGFKTMLRLLRGHLLDALGRRDEALAEYRKVMAGPDADFSRARAGDCLDAPCGREEDLRFLHALAEGDFLERPRAGRGGGNGIETPRR
ncbi:MAG: hypothetical protein HY079_02440 [Elusimicrobia bacterium]|nr:hypothetical protein [Elusimicrobiota bacterium]